MPITLVRKAGPSDDAIQRAAEAMEGRVREAFLRAVAAVRDRVQLDKLAEALSRGDANAALAILAVDEKFAASLRGAGIEPGIASFREAVQQAFAAGARAALQALPRSVSVEMAFDLTNPRAVRFAEEYAYGLIREVSQQTRDGVQRIVARALQEGGHPVQQAREIKQFIGLTARQEQAVANYRAALEGGSLRDALRRALRDGRYDKSLLKAIREGRGLKGDFVDKLVERYRQRFLQYRARNVARTETLRAANKGRREAWRQAVDQGLLPDDVKRKWIVSGDCRTCEVCLELEGEERGLDEEFAPGIMDPPDPHPQCRCTTALVLGKKKR